MKYLFTILFFANIYIYSQDLLVPIDKIANDGSSNFPKVSSAPVYVQSVNITGNLNELVIPVGFPDLPSTQAYPTLVNNPLYPKLGQTFSKKIHLCS